ncbi:nucleotidyltransferase family protein [Tamlana sp. 62-3]|uniref:Nucleotidyltransferase family protein n=1 Tax=Neotamlana sargassicola TaxID=2883125 RepID=A0A9X1I6N1_9FLAO|nr:nucleotidyltransferase family protein [Tamlana sargassicola]MCB4808257.1 nucleotidyltransferase family protein [Tamlana sargassicola]
MFKNTKNIAVVVLAAGASTRMGEPKQLLPWKNSTLIAHTIETVLQVNCKNVYVVLGANFDLISSEIKDYPISILNNELWHEGLGTSIAFSINFILNSDINIDAVLFVLADQPFIDSDYINKMITGYNVDNKSIVATYYSDKKIGVPVLFDKLYFKYLKRLQGDEGAKHIIKDHEYAIKTLIPPNKNVDLDTKEDYQLLVSRNFEFK